MPYAMGDLTIDIEADSKLGSMVQSGIAEALDTTGRRADIIYRFPDKLCTRSGRMTSNVLIGSEGARINRYDLLIDVHRSGSCLHFDVAQRKTDESASRLINELSRCRSPSHLTPLEHSAHEVLADLFTWSSQIVQLRWRQAYIHASVMRAGKRTLAIMGWRGICKTTVQLALCIDRGWEYISDDLAVIDERRSVYRTPHQVKLFGFNMAAHAEARKRAFASRTVIDRLSAARRTHKYGAAHVRRLLSPNRMFTPVPRGEGSYLTDLLYIERGGEVSSSISVISGDELARRMALISLSEMGSYATLQQQMEILGDHTFPTEQHIHAQVKAILRDSFQGLRIPVLQLRDGFAPEEVVSQVLDMFEKGQTMASDGCRALAA